MYMPKRESKETVKVKTSPSAALAGEKEKHAMKDQSVKKQLAKGNGKPGKSPEKSIRGIEGIKKVYIKSKSSCKVTFTLPKEAAGEAKKVTVVGDFNAWDNDASPMKRLSTGSFEITLELPSKRDYRFRYFIDGCRWENDWCADEYKLNPYGSDDSVVIV
jgi:hypothetical protein